jgi:thymidylate synthase (FAD)
MTKQIKLVTTPTVIPIAEMKLDSNGMEDMREWVKLTRPECLPEEGNDWNSLFPTGKERPTYDAEFAPELELQEGDPTYRVLTDNELLVELAGRTCYHSYGLKAGKKTNKSYIANMQIDAEGKPLKVPHASVLYHAKMSFFFANISRRVSHELIRNYVGADRDEEGSPSQESTRYTEHPGHYVVPPLIRDDVVEVEQFRNEMQHGYGAYLSFIKRQCDKFAAAHGGEQPKSGDRKLIYEAASFYLHHSVTTSFVWTCNPMSARKFFRERCDKLADAEMQCFANTWKKICLDRWPNLFPGTI